MNIKNYIKKIKNENIQILGPSINYIKNRKELITEIIESTGFLSLHYQDISLNQRFYHLFFDLPEIEKCDFCELPKKFSIYNRFSPEKNKSHSNYYKHCGSLECEIRDFKSKGGSGKGYGGLIGKITKNLDLKNQLLEKTSFLNKSYDQISDSQRFYHIFFEKYEIENCYCGKPRKFSVFNKFSSEKRSKKGSNYNETCNSAKCISEIIAIHTKEGVEKKYGVENIWKIPGYREKLEKTNIEKYGTPYVMGSNNFKEKVIEKIEKDWGGKHPTKFKSVQDKKRKTNLERYGVDCVLKDREKIKKGMIEKYGEDHNMKLEDHKNNHRKIMEDKFGGVFMKSDEIKRKSQETNLGKYGYKFATQNEEISEKQFLNSRKFKNYYFPSGKLINIQGFEDKALDILLNKYKEDDIETSRKEITKLVGNFMYNLEGINRRYFPDIYIKSINTIIEVKSEYTFSKDLVKNNLKKLSVENKNINFEYMIFSNDGKKLIS